jgi:hypothetical protein
MSILTLFYLLPQNQMKKTPMTEAMETLQSSPYWETIQKEISSLVAPLKKRVNSDFSQEYSSLSFSQCDLDRHLINLYEKTLAFTQNIIMREQVEFVPVLPEEEIDDSLLTPEQEREKYSNDLRGLY